MTSVPLETSGLHGFVYVIYNHIDKKYYIGKKTFRHGGKKSYRRNGKRVPNYKHGTENDWKTYTGSSEELNAAIKEHGKENFSFVMLRLFKTRGGLSYMESNIQHKLDVLTAVNNKDERLFYNGNIAATKYLPKEIGEPA